jgi:hypothetical protein
MLQQQKSRGMKPQKCNSAVLKSFEFYSNFTIGEAESFFAGTIQE